VTVTASEPGYKLLPERYDFKTGGSQYLYGNFTALQVAEGAYYVTSTVADDLGLPISGAKVALSGGKKWETFTGNDGRFYFELL
jgi:hypothetical protein